MWYTDFIQMWSIWVLVTNPGSYSTKISPIWTKLNFNVGRWSAINGIKIQVCSPNSLNRSVRLHYLSCIRYFMKKIHSMCVVYMCYLGATIYNKSKGGGGVAMFDVKWQKQLFKYLIYALHEVLVWNRVFADVKDMAACVKENCYNSWVKKK